MNDRQPASLPGEGMPSEITLYVTVVDSTQHLKVGGLKASDFSVYEDEKLQQITSFGHDDLPVSIGILVDNSGSMRDKRLSITAAMVDFVKSSNPQDEFFVVNFNDESFLDQDFTDRLALIRDSLNRLDSRGGTALYDAVITSAAHLDLGAKFRKRVLLVVTDGEDNESLRSLEEAIHALQEEDGPAVYTIGILGAEAKPRRAKRALEAFALQTGGAAFFPKNLDELPSMCQAIARDLRTQYNISYRSSNSPANGQARQIRVLTPNHDFQTRSRSSYFPSKERSTHTNRTH